MSDTLYLSLWYPNLRLEGLGDKLTAVLGAFAAHGGEARVYAATVWPVNWSESPVFSGFTAGWAAGGSWARSRGWPWKRRWSCCTMTTPMSSRSDGACGRWKAEPQVLRLRCAPLRMTDLLGLDARWVREPRLVRVTGYGPLFDEAAYEADGHIRVEFGPDAPFLEEGIELDPVAARHVEENVRQLVELTAALEKESGATARLLWSELGESLAARLAARLRSGELRRAIHH